jgi:glycosyltransferase involved in cell wall biosynthesis
VITVSFNSAEFIKSAIESVLSQSYSDIEYIVIDGSSTDGTQYIIQSYSGRISRVVSEPDKGIYDAMNKGVALATGDIIGILNSDDFYPSSNVIARVAENFKKNDGVDLVLGNVDFVYEDNLTKAVRFYSSYKFKPWKMRFGFMPAHPGAFIRRSAYEKIGNYKLGYKIGADFDMFVRMLVVSKLSYVTVNETFVRMRIGGVSTSGFESYKISTLEMLRSLNENNVYSNILFVLVRLPFKAVQKLKFKLGLK